MPPRRDVPVEKQAVEIVVDGVVLKGDLQVPNAPRGLVLFAHGSGSSRRSRRNRFVAEYLNGNGLATLLFDLLTSDEEDIDTQTRELRFNVDLLGGRLVGATDWVRRQPEFGDTGLGYFGASTGAAAALFAAAERPDLVRAVVSRGGRPDLAGSVLSEVIAPTLLIVGGEDPRVIEVNQAAYGQIRADPKHLAIVPGATHLFEEPGALEQVATLAGGWFGQYLPMSL